MTTDEFAIFETWHFKDAPSYSHKSSPSQAEAAWYVAGLFKETLTALEDIVAGSSLIARDSLSTPGLPVQNAATIGQVVGGFDGMCFELYHLVQMISGDVQHASRQEINLPEWRTPNQKGPKNAKRAALTLHLVPDKLRELALLIDVNLPAALDPSTTRTRMIDFPRRARVQAAFEALAEIIETKSHLLSPDIGGAKHPTV